ncbi:MAG TPA: winged helix DNA-binding domain-containing protein [Streptosporangiaceae bacterium]|nr:winged helix DNA-binding domain-containing protein [Streptosporangiaceae bacterium]
MYRLHAAERRRRLAVRHGLAPASPGPSATAQVVRKLVALHATDPATVYLSVRARHGGDVSAAEISDALYEKRDLVRMLAMRRTVFVVPAESVPVVQASTTDRIARDQRARLLKLLSATGVAADPQAWLADVERSVLSLIAERGGTATAAELSAAEPRLRTTLVLAAGKPYEGTQTITSRVLLVLAAHGHLVRGRPVGSWLSQQYRWVLAEHWLPPSAPVGEVAARAELASQWLAAFGPAPLADLKWWTGWTMGQARQAVADLGAVEVDLGQGTGFVLPGDLEATADPGTWVVLLPALDPTVMGWSERSWFLGPHGTALFDVNGNAGPTVWLNGRVVGGWAQRPDGEIAVRLLEDVGAEGAAQIEAEAGRLGAWLGTERFLPRFRTPTERELSAASRSLRGGERGDTASPGSRRVPARPARCGAAGPRA